MKQKNWRRLLIDAELNYRKIPLYQTIKKKERENWLEELINSETFSAHFDEMKDEIRRFKDIIKKSDKKVTKINVMNKEREKTMIIDNDTLTKSKTIVLANPYHLKNIVIVKMMEILAGDDMIFYMSLDEKMRQYLNEEIISNAFSSIIPKIKEEIFLSSLKRSKM